MNFVFCVIIALAIGLVESHTLAPEFGGMQLYGVLEVPVDATFDSIKKKYRQLSLKYHPDKAAVSNITTLEANEKFTLINTAYEIIGDPKTRRLYDIYGVHYADMEKYFGLIAQFHLTELYAYRPNILILFDGNFDRVLAKSPYTWIVTFYRSACGSCKKMVPINVELSTLAQRGNSTRVAVVNCDASAQICHNTDLAHMGQVFFFPSNQDSTGLFDKVPYEGPLMANMILTGAERLPQSKVKTMNSLQELLSHVESTSTKTKTIQSRVAGIWLADFWRPSCPPCRVVKSALRQLADELEGVAQIATIDCDTNSCPGIHSFPSIRIIIKRLDNTVEIKDFDYDGERHPAIAAMRITGFILREVVGLHWSPEAKFKDEL